MEETNCENLCEATACEFSNKEILPSLITRFIIQYFMISAHRAVPVHSAQSTFHADLFSKDKFPEQ